jgi:hypothetical protein
MGSIIGLLLMLLGGVIWFWFCWPAISDVIKLKRHNARISALTKQTKRDMDNLARRQRKDGW